MKVGRARCRRALLVALSLIAFAGGSTAAAEGIDTGGPTASQFVTWTCTGSPCPWGATTDGHAVVWAVGGLNTRLGYTVSAGIYLPGSSANGMTVSVVSGEASLYAGTPGASSHRRLALLTAGRSHEVSGLAAGEVLSVQDDAGFTFTLSSGPAPTTTTTTTQPPTTTTTTTQPSSTTTQPPATTTQPPTTTTQPPGSGATPSQLVEWTCTGSPCPWGPSSDGHAVVWPAGSGATNLRLGYTVSAGIYLPSGAANGATVSVISGKASVYAGVPGASSHRRLAILNQGQSYVVTGVSSGEVLSVQDPAAFTHEITLASEQPPSDACTDPLTCDPIDSIRSFWRCDIPACNAPDWHGGVIAWPEWSAYANNKRTGNMSRTLYSYDGEPLYGYVGSWIDGCKITVVEGNALIVEWQRGSDAWRSTYLGPGEQHTIDLVGAEDGVLIETPDTPTDFSITLDNCTPQPVPKP